MPTLADLDEQIAARSAAVEDRRNVKAGDRVRISLKTGAPVQFGEVVRLNPKRIIVRLAGGSIVERRRGEVERCS